MSKKKTSLEPMRTVHLAVREVAFLQPVISKHTMTEYNIVKIIFIFRFYPKKLYINWLCLNLINCDDFDNFQKEKLYFQPGSDDLAIF